MTYRGLSFRGMACLFVIVIVFSVLALPFLALKSDDHVTGRHMTYLGKSSSPTVVPTASAQATMLGGRGGGAVVTDPGRDPDNNPPQSGPGASCKSSLWATPLHAIQLFWPGMAGFLAEKYASVATTDLNGQLCFDNWNFQQMTCTMTIKQIFTVLGWPQDLLSSNGEYVQCVAPLTNAQRGQLIYWQNQASQTTTAPASSNTSCVLHLDVGITADIPVCEVVKIIINATIAQPLNTALSIVRSQTDTFLWTTPGAYSYENATVIKFWNISIGIVGVFLVVAIAWAGFRGMIGASQNWLSYAEALEYIPRILLGLALSIFSLQLCKGLITLTNALDTLGGSGSTIDQLVSIQPDRLITTVFAVLFEVVVFAVILEEIVRYAILYLLIGFAPLWCFAACLKEFSGLTKGCVKGLVWFALLQPLQNLLMLMGVGLVASLVGSGTATILNYLVAIAIMIMTLSLFFVIARSTLGGIAAPAGAALLGAAAGAALRLGRDAHKDLPSPSPRNQRQGSRGGAAPRTPAGKAASGGGGSSGFRAVAGRAAVQTGKAAVGGTARAIGYAGRAAGTIARESWEALFPMTQAATPANLLKKPATPKKP